MDVEDRKPVTYPEDAYQVWWDYNQGEVLRDETAKELAGYYARMLSWYTKGASPTNWAFSSVKSPLQYILLGSVERARSRAQSFSKGLYKNL